MTKKCLKIMLLIVLLIMPMIVSAAPNIPTLKEQTFYKWYDGSDKWSKSQVSPVGITVDSKLIEGVDYVREYAFTRSRSVSPDNKDLVWKNSAYGMKESGFIYERVRGIGKYSNNVSVRHEIYTAIYVYANDVTKEEGEEDPKFSYSIKVHNNNPNNVINLFDISFKREEGEEVGTYKITPVIEIKFGTSLSELIKIGSMAIGDYTNGRIYLYPKEGTLTIKEKSTGKVLVKYIDENTLEELDYETLEGKVGDEYITRTKDITGYNYTGNYEGNINGIFSENEETVIYYYSSNSKKVSINEDIIEAPDTGI